MSRSLIKMIFHSLFRRTPPSPLSTKLLALPAKTSTVIRLFAQSSRMGAILAVNRKSVDMTSPQAEFVRDAIETNRVVIFSKSYCPYCSMAKEQFQKLDVSMVVIELDSRSDANEIQNVLGEITGGRTVPRCFVNGKFIGGGTDVKKMYEDGTLQKYFQ